ncbi:MAG: DedA family protein [Bacteroidales bacterium]|nr:DedA family protein [Bacteroidales bacterium]
MEGIYLYLALFLGVVIEGETALTAGALIARKGMMNIWIMGIVALTGTLLADWTCFFTGRVIGDRLLDRFPYLHRKSIRPRAWIRKNPLALLILYRFLYGFRITTLIITGMSRVSVKKFMLISTGTTVVWTVMFASAGYFLGGMIQRYLARLEGIALYLVIGAILALLLVLAIRNLVKRWM